MCRIQDSTVQQKSHWIGSTGMTYVYRRRMVTVPNSCCWSLYVTRFSVSVCMWCGSDQQPVTNSVVLLFSSNGLWKRPPNRRIWLCSCWLCTSNKIVKVVKSSNQNSSARIRAGCGKKGYMAIYFLLFSAKGNWTKIIIILAFFCFCKCVFVCACS